MKRHRNILYTLVCILLILQIISFVTLSSRVVETQGELAETRKAIRNVSDTFAAALAQYDTQTQRNFNDVSLALSSVTTKLSQQQSSFDEQLTLLKSKQGDFSGIISKAVKSVVTVRTDRSLGSGFVVDERGYIVTNYHVIAGAQKIAVATHDSRIIGAVLLSVDKTKDLALLKIDGSYPALPLADSDKLKVGNKVVAIGNPLGLSFTVTEGIVSGLDREGPNGLEAYIQTDVSLNPGNSGGPLIDTNGAVVGINNFKVGDAESLGFALESNVLKQAIVAMSNATVVLS
jgi:S1-C subfamily serine protease